MTDRNLNLIFLMLLIIILWVIATTVQFNVLRARIEKLENNPVVIITDETFGTLADPEVK